MIQPNLQPRHVAALIMAFAVSITNVTGVDALEFRDINAESADVINVQSPTRNPYPRTPRARPRSDRACVERCSIRCRSAQNRCNFAPGQQRAGYCSAQAIQCRSSCAASCR